MRCRNVVAAMTVHAKCLRSGCLAASLAVVMRSHTFGVVMQPAPTEFNIGSCAI